jgi:hypothetical protein
MDRTSLVVSTGEASGLARRNEQTVANWLAANGGTDVRKVLFVLALVSLLAVPALAVSAGGSDQFGYNYGARIFVGPADGVDRVLDGKVWGDPTYAKDRLVMKWSQAWDDARFHGAPWTPDAWCNNEWNGKVPGGSGWTEHVKIIWVGPDLEASPYWKGGGTQIWGEFEVIMDQGIDPSSGHVWWTHAVPCGYGAQ